MPFHSGRTTRAQGVINCDEKRAPRVIELKNFAFHFFTVVAFPSLDEQARESIEGPSFKLLVVIIIKRVNKRKATRGR